MSDRVKKNQRQEKATVFLRRRRIKRTGLCLFSF